MGDTAFCTISKRIIDLLLIQVMIFATFVDHSSTNLLNSGFTLCFIVRVFINLVVREVIEGSELHFPQES